MVSLLESLLSRSNPSPNSEIISASKAALVFEFVYPSRVPLKSLKKARAKLKELQARPGCDGKQARS